MAEIPQGIERASRDLTPGEREVLEKQRREIEESIKRKRKNMQMATISQTTKEKVSDHINSEEFQAKKKMWHENPDSITIRGHNDRRTTNFVSREEYRFTDGTEPMVEE